MLKSWHVCCTLLARRRLQSVNKAFTRILLIIIVLAMAALACVGGGGGGGVDGSGSNSDSNISSSSQTNVDSPDATATYGAQQLHIQLTEIAR